MENKYLNLTCQTCGVEFGAFDHHEEHITHKMATTCPDCLILEVNLSWIERDWQQADQEALDALHTAANTVTKNMIDASRYDDASALIERIKEIPTVEFNH